MNSGKRIEQFFFVVCAALVLLFFLWSRLDSSNHIYYFGDGNVIVELIRLMVSNHDWDPNWARLKDVDIQPELAALRPTPVDIHIFYNLSGYTVIGAALCKIIFAAGFTDIPIQAVLRGFNVAMQLATLLLLFITGKKILNHYAGIVAALFFVVFPLVVMEAHYERPETWLCFLTSALLYACVCFYESPLRNSSIIGITIGLSIATKINQVFLGILPAITLGYFWLASQKSNFSKTTTSFFIFCGLILASIIITLLINTPFLIAHINEVINGLKSQSSFYDTPNYPYSEEHYAFFGQLWVSLRYFWFTLGGIWCVLLLTGLAVLIKELIMESLAKKVVSLLILLPLIFLFTFSALLTVFVERTLSSIEGILCLVSAIGFVHCTQILHRTISSQKLMPALIAGLFLITIVIPARIDYLFVSRYIKHPDKPLRAAFQEKLKKDFHGFWIKNVYFSLKITGELPDKPEKAPRLYQIDDLNEHWTKNYLEKLEQNGFKKVGVYCSEFSSQPPNTLTIYHAAAKNHYYVRDDEWPADVPGDYFKTNCQ